jgi:CRP-like cAMP-binding protein
VQRKDLPLISSESLFVSPLEKAIANISPLSPESGNAFINAWKYWSVPKDHFLLREQSISDYIYFIEKGVARIYYYKNEKEITEWIALDQQFFLSITSFFERTPSHLIIQTIEPSEVYGIHHNDFMTLADKYHDIERLLRKMVTRSLILSQVRMDSIQFETAQQRYEGLVKNLPNILQRVPLSYIASFLGVTLETLSRIRSQK